MFNNSLYTEHLSMNADVKLICFTSMSKSVEVIT